MAKPFSNYKKERNRLVPPFMEAKWLVETSFIKEKIPEFFWLSSIILQCPGTEGASLAIDFIGTCEEIIGKYNTKPLVYLSNFLLLTAEQKESLLANAKLRSISAMLSASLQHHLSLIEGYPLGTIVPRQPVPNAREHQIERLKNDVDGLLDRTSLHVTKVLVTWMMALVLTNRMHFPGNSDIPDIPKIFESPSPEEVARIGAFVRSAVTAEHGISVDNEIAKEWRASFWQQCFDISPCSK